MPTHHPDTAGRTHPYRHWLHLAASGLALCAALSTNALAQSAAATDPKALQARAADEVAPLLDSLKALVGIESGSRDLEGLAQIAAELTPEQRKQWAEGWRSLGPRP